LLFDHENIEEDDQPRINARSTLRRLLPWVRPHWRVFAAAAVTVSIITACELAGPWLLGRIIDVAISHGTDTEILTLAGGYFLTFVVAASTGYLQMLMLTRMGLSVITAIKQRVFAHLLSLSTTFHDKNPVGKLISRTESDAEQIKELFSRVAVNLGASFIKFVAILTVMMLWDPRLGIVLLLLVPVMAVATFWFLKTIKKIYRQSRMKYAELAGMVTEYVQGVPVVQQFNQKERAVRLLDEKNQAKFRVDMRAWYLDYSFWGCFIFAEAIAAVLVLRFGTSEVVAGAIEVGVVVTFLEYTRRVFEPIVVLGEQLNQVQRATASADRVFDLLDTPPDVADAPGALEKLHLKREFRLENVSFSYDGAKNVLEGITFTVARGEKIALVGPSGGGKTTLVGLICRFLDPTKGAVLVDGVDIRKYTQKAWRDRIGLVLQEIYMFPGTVLDNLRVLDRSIPEEQVRKAAAAVTADRFIGTIPGGYQANLAERGSNLSLGERQILSFARALTADPELLVLDEATSSVDSETEMRIQQSLDRLLAGRTAVIVAHRLSTIRSADRILVVKGGRIVEEGPHDELYAAGGLYRELYDLQETGNGRGKR
jgi:ABC-type multidrug transport system fused ATPase/permease subunit